MRTYNLLLFILNSNTKAVINFKCDLDKSFQEVSDITDNKINVGSGWITEIVEAEYVNISVYIPLPGSIYFELPRKLRNSMKGLINIKNNDNKCFLWCHVRHPNPLNIHPERITKIR